ncbi:hypothetical protein ACVMB1_000592 [Bradyrhizobium sp. USDA 4504]
MTSAILALEIVRMTTGNLQSIISTPNCSSWRRDSKPRLEDPWQDPGTSAWCAIWTNCLRRSRSGKVSVFRRLSRWSDQKIVQLTRSSAGSDQLEALLREFGWSVLTGQNSLRGERPSGAGSVGDCLSVPPQYLGQHFRARYVQASKSLTYSSLVVSSIVPGSPATSQRSILVTTTFRSHNASDRIRLFSPRKHVPHILGALGAPRLLRAFPPPTAASSSATSAGSGPK